MSSFFAVALARILSGLVSNAIALGLNIIVPIWDLGLTLYNLVAPSLPANGVVPAGHPGAGGKWPKYVAPTEGDSRCSCPALNAMANHGILPHDGRNITFRQLGAAVRNTYNFSPTFCFFVPNFMAGILCRSYWSDTLDLSDIDVHNGIEHDASLLREDAIVSQDQSKVSLRLADKLLACGTGPGGDLTIADLSAISGKRRAESKKANSQFSLSFMEKMFASSNSSTLLTLFGGRIEDIRPFVLEERIPDGWQPRVTNPMGLTISEFNATVFQVELGIKEEVPWLNGDAHHKVQ